jgi:hypothetical protein
MSRSTVKSEATRGAKLRRATEIYAEFSKIPLGNSTGASVSYVICQDLHGDRHAWGFATERRCDVTCPMMRNPPLDRIFVAGK